MPKIPIKLPTCFGPQRTILRDYVKYILVTLARLDVLPEDGPLGTETCRSFIGIFGILMCVNMI